MHHSEQDGFRRIDAPATQAAREAFAAAAKAQPEMAMHGDDPAKMGEHMAAMELAARAEATHVAVAHGSWFDPDTWVGGAVPGAGARVLIPEGIEVAYDGVSEAALFTVRVDGHLTFATEGAVRMRLDTMVTSPTGHLTVGTADDPVTGDVRIDFVNSGDIDVGWDAMLLSRGLIAHGTTTIHGAATQAHVKVADDPMAGDSSVTLDGLPQGWSVGDTLVIAGTVFEGHKWDNDIRATRWHETEDEVRTVTRIEETEAGTVLHFAEALVHDHATPRADLKTSVANMSRSVTFATEDADNAAVHQRAHVMFMHSDAVDVRYAAFDDLGRTDKSERAVPVESLETVTADANVQGRYSVHLHRTGTVDAETPAMLVGNAVSGAPGWGYVHHDGHAVLHGNASFDTFGAGYVAETGNETGSWTGNIAIGAEGLRRLVKDGADVKAFDLGRTGDGFWFQGRMVESAENVAASVNHGFVYAHRGAGMLEFDASVHDFPELFPGQSVRPDDAPILEFRDNEAFAAKEGLHVVKANPDQGHDVHSHLARFTAWEVKSGAHLQYTSHYTLEDFDLTGRATTPFNTASTGISFGNNVSDMAVIGGAIAGFAKGGIDLKKSFVGNHGTNDPALHAFHVVGTAFGKGQTPLLNHDPALDTVLDARPEAVAPRLILDRPLTYKEGWQDPEGRKVIVTGTKIDSLGATPFPAGTDEVVFGRDEVVHILETDGYWTRPDGQPVFVVEILMSDRLTGEIVKVGHLVEIDANVPLGNPYHGYGDALYRGEAAFGAAPETEADTATTQAGVDVLIDVTGNDRDPDGTAPILDGTTQPKHGEVFAQPDGTLLYRPDIGFAGVDSFAYWASDGLNLTRETVTVTVEEAPQDAVPEPPAETPVMEFGTVSLSHRAVTVALDGSYDDPVVVASLRTKAGADPVVVRIDAVSADSVTMRLIEPENLNGKHVAETVDFMVVEAGSWTLADGTQVSAGTVGIDRLGIGGATAIETGLATEDAIFAQHQQTASGAWSAARIADGADGPEALLHVAEGRRSELQRGSVEESVGWVAFDGSGTDEASALFRFGTIGGVSHRGRTVDLHAELGASPAGVLHSLVSKAGNDTAVSRGTGLSDDRFSVQVQEETSRDAEVWHVPEQVSLLAFTEAARDGVIGGVATGPAGAPPVARDDAAETTSDAPLTFAFETLLENDSDPDGGALMVVSVGGAAGGTVEIVEGGVVFTPADGFEGVGFFTYTVADADGMTAEAVVSVDVTSGVADRMQVLVGAADADAGRGLADPSLATGLSGFAYWTSPPFLNLMKQSRLVTQADGETLRFDALVEGGWLDADGYPLRDQPAWEGLAPWQGGYDYILAMHQATDEIRAETEGSYTIEWSGNGRVTAIGLQETARETFQDAGGNVTGGRITGVWDAADTYRTIRIKEIEPGNHVRDVSVVKSEWVDLHEAGAVFDPRYLDDVSDMHTLRFMGWMEANGSDVTALDDVATPDSASWKAPTDVVDAPTVDGGDVLLGGRQIPFEVMVQLANETRSDPWFTIPLKADDDYVRALAAYVEAHLDDGLVAKFELSNEVWNTASAFEQSREASMLGPTGPDAPYSAASARDLYGYRSAEIRAILDDAMTAGRAEMVLATQTVWTWIAERTEDGVQRWFADQGRAGQMSDVFDALAVTGYFSGIERTEFDALRQRWYAESEALFADGRTPDKHAYFVERAAAYLADGAGALTAEERALVGPVSNRLADPMQFLSDNFAKNAALASSWGLELIQYEADSHAAPKDYRSDPESEWLGALNKSPQMAELTTEMTTLFREAGGTLVNDFGNLGHTEFGLWGTRNHFGDANPISGAYDAYNRTATDRFGAVDDDRDAGTFLHGVTARGTDGADVLTGTTKRDYLLGGEGHDLLVGGAGADGLHGGAGVDGVLLGGSAADWDIAFADGVLTATRDGVTDRLVEIELLGFAQTGEVHATADWTGEGGDRSALIQTFVSAHPDWDGLA